jgi:hypothetical protein
MGVILFRYNSSYNSRTYQEVFSNACIDRSQLSNERSLFTDNKRTAMELRQKRNLISDGYLHSSASLHHHHYRRNLIIGMELRKSR